MTYKILSLLFAAAIVYSISFIPQYIIEKTPQMEYTYPALQSYQEKVTASGTVSYFSKRESYLSSPAIPAKVYVSVGDYVEKNQILAEIDIQQTKYVLENSLDVTQAMSSISSKDLSELSALMEAYGLSGNGISQILEQHIPQVAMVQNLENTVIPQYITAPMSGIVTELRLQEGVLAEKTSTPAAVVADTSQYRAIVEVSEADISKVQRGNRAIIYGSGFPEKSYEGVVEKIHPTAQPGSSLAGGSAVTAEIRIENPDEKLLDGFSVTAEILVGEEREVMSIPYEAIRQDESNSEYVYVFAGGKAVKKEVSTGSEMTYSAQVEGLAAEDRVILSPHNLEDGSRVLLTEYAPLQKEESGGNRQ